jgi:hypothetical protein
MELIVIGILYLLGLGFFQRIGGLPGAADAFQSWGRASASARPNGFSPSS